MGRWRSNSTTQSRLSKHLSPNWNGWPARRGWFPLRSFTNNGDGQKVRCGNSGRGDRETPSEVIYARARAGVVIIGAIPGADNPDQSEPVFASGFVVHKDGLIVSNAHVIEAFRDMKAVGAMTSDGRVFPIKAVLAADRLNDAALFKIDAIDLTPLPMAESVPVGATIYCLSHPVMNCMGTEHGSSLSLRVSSAGDTGRSSWATRRSTC